MCEFRLRLSFHAAPSESPRIARQLTFSANADCLFRVEFHEYSDSHQLRITCYF
jgi:hypothetical protein